MDIRHARTAVLRILLAVATSALATSAVAKDDLSNSRVIGGVAIYLGLMPAELVQGHPKQHPEEAHMHGGPPAKGHRDHVLVALFDSATGQRIENADVTAQVMEIGLASVQRKLEPMKVADTITFGNYFDFPADDTYHINVRIRLPGRSDVIEARFTHRHFSR